MTLEQNYICWYKWHCFKLVLPSLLLALMFVPGLSAQTFTLSYGNALYNEGVAAFQLPDSGYFVVANSTGFYQNTSPYLFKVDKEGVLQKDFMPGFLFLVHTNCAAIKDDKIYLGGYALVDNTYKCMVIQTDTNGQVTQEKYWGGNGWCFVNSITINNGDTLFYCGESNATTFGYQDGIVGAISPGFSNLWQQTIGGDYFDAFNSISLDGDTAIVCAGATSSYIGSPDTAIFLCRLGLEGSTKHSHVESWSGPTIAYSLKPDNSGGYFLCGVTSRWNASQKQGFLSKLDDDFKFTQTEQFGATEDYYIYDATQTGTGDYFLTGSYSGGYSAGELDLMVTNCDKGGYWSPALASMYIGGLADDEGCNIISTYDGGLLATGTTKSFSHRMSSVFLFKCTADGTHQQYSGHQTYIREFSEKNSCKITVFPNPAQQYINIKIDNPKQEKGINVAVTDLTGRVLLETIIPSSSLQDKHKIEISTLQKGVYIVVVGDKKVLFQKL